MSTLKVHVEYLDGRPAEDHEMPVNYPPGQEKSACMQLLAAINSIGLILFDNDAVTLIPISSMKSVKVLAPSVILADATALSRVKL